jgi:hypothetical protein
VPITDVIPAAPPPPAPVAPKPPPPKKRPKEEEDDEASFLQRKSKPILIAAGSFGGMMLLYFALSSLWSGEPARVPVYPARGEARFEGKSMPNAAIFLHPIGVEDPDYPRPRSTANADGTFELGTYGKDDGAPAGEYRVTVQWFVRPKVAEPEGGAAARNQLPARYSRPETSGLTVRIQPGENKLPALDLKR